MTDPSEPPAPEATAPVAGWHPDPSGSGRQRWHDGDGWTDQYGAPVVNSTGTPRASSGRKPTYYVTVNRGRLSIRRMTKVLVAAAEKGWRPVHMFQQRRNTVVVYEAYSYEQQLLEAVNRLTDAVTRRDDVPKWFGKQEPEPKRQQVLRVPPGPEVVVKGEASYQDAIARIAGGRQIRDEGVQIPVQAQLRCEPTNQYDANAVQVLIDGNVVGYLSKKEATRYCPVITRAEQAGALVFVEGLVCGGWSDGDQNVGHFGVKVFMPPPDEVARLL